MGNWTVHLCDCVSKENDTEYLRWIVYFRAVDGLEEGAKIFLTSLYPSLKTLGPTPSVHLNQEAPPP